MSAGNGRTELCDYEHEMSVLSQLDDAEKTIEALQQANEQLQAQAAQYREAVEVLETVTEHLENCYRRNTPDTEKAREVLAAIDALGGAEDGK